MRFQLFIGRRSSETWQFFPSCERGSLIGLVLCRSVSVSVLFRALGYGYKVHVKVYFGSPLRGPLLDVCVVCLGCCGLVLVPYTNKTWCVRCLCSLDLQRGICSETPPCFHAKSDLFTSVSSLSLFLTYFQYDSIGLYSVFFRFHEKGRCHLHVSFFFADGEGSLLLPLLCVGRPNNCSAIWQFPGTRLSTRRWEPVFSSGRLDFGVAFAVERYVSSSTAPA